MRLSIMVAIGAVLLGACTADGAQTTATPAAVVNEGQWYSDAEKEAADPGGEHVWVAAWFAGEDALPESIVRRWRPLQDAGDASPGALLRQSVELLDEPPPEATSAFAEGLAVREVSVSGGQVLIDLDAASPGLYGHGSAGYVIGSEQLASAAAYYFPEAQTLCVAYDGEPTVIEEGGPSFLHDASGCPIPLR